MRLGIGISTGTEVVCAALVAVDDDGSQIVEYRTVSADTEANTDIGDLVSSAIELMTSLAPAPAGQGAHGVERQEPESIAVSYRTPEQAASIRSACAHSRRTVALIPESAAAHAFLADSGLIARYRSVTVVDIGASGTTTSIIDSHSGVVLRSERTETFGGNVVNDVVKELVQGRSGQGRVRDDLRDDRGVGSARYRAVKELLSTHESADIDRMDGSTGVDRAEFDAALRTRAVAVAESALGAAAGVNDSPEAVVLIGGGANIPLLRTVYESTLHLPTLVPSEPDTILAKGAAHVALDSPANLYPTIGFQDSGQPRSVSRFSGALVGALLVGGIVLAYGIQTLTPTDDSGFSPAGSAAPSESAEQTTDQPIANTAYPTVAHDGASTTSAEPAPGYSEFPAQPSSTAAVAPTAAGSTTTRTPTLHPAPDLPIIPWPAQPSQTSSPPPTVLTPAPTTSVPPVESPGESGAPEPTPTPESPSETPEGSTALTPPSSIPTTVVDRTPGSHELTPPPTVWSPPAPVPPASGSSNGETLSTTVPTTAPTTPPPNPTTTTE